jgi:UPF0755 protein
MWKHIAANGLSLLILLAIALAGVVGWGQRQWVADGPLEQAIFFEVPRGASCARCRRIWRRRAPCPRR